MPLKLVAPSARSPNWRIRGTHLGITVDRSAQTSDRKLATKALAALKREIEDGKFRVRTDNTFADAVISYVNAGGDKRFLLPLVDRFGDTPVDQITQAQIDQAAVDIYPDATPATRNRQVHAVMSIVLKRAGVDMQIKRPKGSASRRRLHYLSYDDAFAFLEAANVVHPRFGALCTFMLYCGTRLSETLSLRSRDVDLKRGYAYIGKTKNGDPQPVHLPKIVIDALSKLDLKQEKVFRLTKSGALYTMFNEAEILSGVQIPEGVSFHIFRHTYGAWMRRQGVDLLYTGRWKNRKSTEVYEHVDVTEEARKADFLPTSVEGLSK